MFGGKRAESKKTKTFVPGRGASLHLPPPPQPAGPSAQEMARIRVSCVRVCMHICVCMCACARVCVCMCEVYMPIFLPQEAIANAKSLEEVQQLEAMLKAGQIPGEFGMSNHHDSSGHRQRGGGYEMEEEEVEG